MECIKFECQSWAGDVVVKPKLVKRGKFWCCPRCGASYGSDESMAQPYSPFDNDSVE